MFINNIDPTLFKFGIFEIRFYGLVYVFGFLLVYYMLYKKRDFLKIKKEQIDNLIIALFVGLIVGARIFNFLVEDPSVFYKNPLELLMIWHGGMSFFGGLLGCFIAAYWYLNKIKVEWKKFADLIIIALTITLIFGRIANYLNSELVGTVSNLPWCVVFSYFDNICRHPYQIYASLSHIVLLGILLVVNKIKNSKQLGDGLIFGTFLIGYSALRFITDFFREESFKFLGLSSWQYICLIILIIGLVLLIKQKAYKPSKKIDDGEKE
jgi:phosphatidylglycerol:prolipoprotein diacylglycerol transferase